jgi:hypothetical protein
MGVSYAVRPEAMGPKEIVSERLARVEVGWNTSTVALRVVGGDEKGTQCLGV